MRTEIINIYKFEELSKHSQEKAIEDFQKDNTHLSWNWSEYTIDYWKEKLDYMGFENTEIQYSGFWSQGDGASFTADVNIEMILNALIYNGILSPDEGDYYLKKFNKYDEWFFDCGMEVSRLSSHYVHEKTCEVSYSFWSLPSFWDEIFDGFGKIIEDFRLEVCKKIYNDLENEYEYLMSSESIKEYIIANDYEFTSNGERY